MALTMLRLQESSLLPRDVSAPTVRTDYELVQVKWRSLIFLVVVFFFSNPTVFAQAVSGEQIIVSPKTIFDAWQNREMRSSTFVATWIHERTYTKHWTNCHVPGSREEFVTLRFGPSILLLDRNRIRFDAGPVDVSGDKVTFDDGLGVDHLGRTAQDTRLRVFQDNRLRYDMGRRPVDPRRSVPPAWPRNLRRFTTLFDGKVNQHFMPQERDSYPEAYIFNHKENLFRGSLYYLPFVLAFRPSWFNLSPEACRTRKELDTASGRESFVLTDDSGLRREFWLDPHRDFNVTQYVEDCDILGVRMQNRIDIQYDQHKNGAWIPGAWTTTFIDNHGLMEQRAYATVLDATVERPIDSDRFKITFPPDTWLFNETTGEHAIVLPDNTLENINREDLQSGAGYSDLIARNSPAGSLRRLLKLTDQPNATRILTLSLLTIGLVSWTYWRAFRPKRNGRTL